ncbi:Alpha-(1,3)-fucosyltransferase C [Aphelenchoides fujianensis]|nr:Alpha-(1,3)-fucosyltransferase C [Aphelenchoides fujianensis]
MYPRLGPRARLSARTAVALIVATTTLFFYFAFFRLQTELSLGRPVAFDDSPSTPEEEPVQRLERRPLIVFWDRYFRNRYALFAPDNSSVAPACPYECDFSLDRNRGKEADVRVFHQRGLDPDRLPPPQADGRFVNVYFNLEPPYLSFSHAIPLAKRPMPLDFFNATATYRSSSEVFYPYDLFVPRDGSERAEDIWTEEQASSPLPPSSLSLQIEEKLKGKRNVSLIAMSNCKSESKRHVYVDALAANIEVTRVGRCNGTIQCSKDSFGKVHRVDLACMKELIDGHYFYLAFENSVCPEYVTEKFWRVKELIVPVVLSRAAMPPHIPADTFIAASDFPTPAALAAHLRWLIAHPAEYRKYFDWTKRYRRSSLSEAELNVSCQLCKLAHRQLERRIPDYTREWGARECVRDYALDLVEDPAAARWRVQSNERWMRAIMAHTYRSRALGRIV